MPLSLNIISDRRAPEQSSARRLEVVRAALLPMDADAAARFFDLEKFDRLLKTTISLCPSCLAHVPAVVYTRGGRVLITKRCGEHGLSHALMESDETFYFLSNKD